MRRTKTTAITIATACLLAGSMAWTQQGPPRGGGGGRGGDRQGPPPEAIEACEDHSEGDACSFEARHGKVEGTCRKPPRGDSDTLACVPNDHEPREGRRGPDEEDER